MRIVAAFDPSTETNTTFSGGFSNGQGRIVVYNQSPNNLHLSWDAFTTYCPAWTAMLYCITSSSVNINWTIQTSLANQSSPPISQVTVEAYDNNEVIMGTYPASLMHQTSIGNAVNTNVTSTNAIVNTGNPPTTPIITVKPSDAASNTWSADNSGNLTVKGDNAGTLTTLLQLIAGASPGVKLAAATILTEVLGNMKVDGTLESVGAATLDSTLAVTGASTLTGNVTFPGGSNQNITWTGGGGGFLSNLQGNSDGSFTYNSSGSTHKFLAGGNTDVFHVNGSGVQLQGSTSYDTGASGQFKGQNGNVWKSISSFDGTSSGTYNHNYGSAPFFIIPMCKVSGSQTMGYDSVTSSQVHITSFSGLGFRAMCFG